MNLKQNYLHFPPQPDYMMCIYICTCLEVAYFKGCLNFPVVLMHVSAHVASMASLAPAQF